MKKDNFNDVFHNLISIPQEAYGLVWRSDPALKNILIHVPKMNEGLTGLEQHEGE